MKIEYTNANVPMQLSRNRGFFQSTVQYTEYSTLYSFFLSNYLVEQPSL